MNLFYAPEINDGSFTLNREESKHLVKVLRMKAGDQVHFTDGRGSIYCSEIIVANPNSCEVKIISKENGKDVRPYRLHIAIAPTKNISRFEWFLEKATEIGIDLISPVICEHSERKEVKTDRLERVLVAAMKQSLKSHLPDLKQPRKFNDLIREPFEGKKFIAYINDEVTLELKHACPKEENALILIGPEGDFSPTEVNLATEHGFQPVSLCKSRLRTETAGVVACHTLSLIND